MARQVPGLIQLLILTAHLCASPTGIIYADWPTQGRVTAFEGSSALKDAQPFAVEEKSRAKPISAAVRAEVVTHYSPPRVAVAHGFVDVPEPLPTLTGYQLQVSERPPPSCV